MTDTTWCVVPRASWGLSIKEIRSVARVSTRDTDGPIITQTMATHTIAVQESESLVAQIVRSVASIHNIQPSELPPLEETIDTDLLQTITELRLNDSVNSGHVAFDYEGITVTVHVNGEVRIDYR